MTCDALRDLIHLHAVDLLEPGEEAVVREHLDAGCPRCAAEMAAAVETASLLPYALPGEEPSPMAKARLMAAVKSSVIGSQPASGPAPAVRPLWRRTVAASFAAALVTGLITGGAMLNRQERLVAAYESLNAELAAQVGRQQEELASLARQVREAKQSIQLVSSPGVQVVDLVGEGDRAGQSARVFWDRGRRSWQLYASNLPAAPAGGTYQLWVITDAGRKISAGTFDTGGEAAAAGQVTVPPDAGRAILAAVTLEPQGGSIQPTTQPFLAGSL